ncbi:MAG: hypothetical protein JW712_14795 [Dehalococcoidales bacterium]|nr:hypothetical protein [Dehalococcoidales bacterium]
MNAQKILNFSEKFLKVIYNSDVKNLYINQKTIVLNAGDTEITIEDKPLYPWNSSIFSSVIIPVAPKIICITLDSEFFSDNIYPNARLITQSWSQIDDSTSHEKTVELWRSKKDKIGNIELNLWYARAGTDCGIHNVHDFREIHTQVFGIGRMQKFHDNKFDSLYQDVYMSPGYTHSPFFDEEGNYPWHQYLADTDCIWLAIEFHSS